MAAYEGCSLDDITSCPSARIIKVLLKRMNKLNDLPVTLSLSRDQTQSENDNESEIIQRLRTVFTEYNYSLTELLNDFHHLKYEHRIEEDDASFDSAFDFFRDTVTESGCDIDQCAIIQRHHRDRGRRGDDSKMDDEDDLLIEIMSMIHCYFIHSQDTTRFTKEERDRIMKMTGLKSWKSVTDAMVTDDGDGDDHKRNESKSTALIMNTVTDILSAKKKRGRSRFRDAEDVVDFTAISKVVGVDEVVIREGLSEYINDRSKLIADLLDVVYGGNSEDAVIWKNLKTEMDRKEIFQKMLHHHFECTHLDTVNLLKFSRYIIGRKKLEIDMESLEDVVTSNGIDGRMFDKTDPIHYQNAGTFKKRFRANPNCKEQHINQLYGAVRKWKYVEMKVVAAEEKEHEEEEEENDVDDVDRRAEKHDVYAIGKRFVFWKSQRKHRNFVNAKYQNMKEELLQSPILSRCFPEISEWHKLMKMVKVMIGTKAALKVTSNGQSFFLYQIEKDQPFDTEHLCALKLYTDYTKLCAVICSVLRCGDPAEIEEMANWVRILIETVQCFGSPLIMERAGKTYFRGVNKTFMFMTIDSRFNLPQSTTSSVCLSETENLFH